MTVSVIDAGIDARHPDLQGQLLDNRNYAAPDAAEIHGTAVAGIIAALANNGQGIVGIAPNAKLIGLKARWPTEANGADAVCDSLSLAQALNTAIQLRPRILNLSLTGPADPLLTTALDDRGGPAGITEWSRSGASGNGKCLPRRRQAAWF